MLRRLVFITLTVVLVLSTVPANAKSKPRPLKSCIAALDAAESVGVASELYEENARRCRTGINTPEKVAKSKGKYTPTSADFVLNVITLEQSCYGSAGCNVSFRVEVSYVGAQLPDEKTSYQVVYEVRGGEDIEIGNFELKGAKYSVPLEDSISTPPNPTLTAVVTGVVKN